MTRKEQRLSMLAAVMLLTAVIYAPTLWYPYVYEDTTIVGYGVEAAKTSGADWSCVYRTLASRCLSSASYTVGAMLGFGPASHRAVSILLHLLCGLALYRLVMRLTFYDYAAVFAAGLFLLHPIQTEAVVYVGVRADVMSTLFVLLSCIAVTKRTYLRALVWLWLAIHTKDSAIGAVAAVALLYAVVNYPLRRRWYVGTAVIMGIVAVYGFRQFDWSPDPQSARALADYTYWEYVGGQTLATLRLAAMTVIPVGQTIDADIWPMLQVPGAAATAMVVMAGAVSWSVYRFRYAVSPVAFAVLWAVCCIAPRLVFRISEWVYEHHWYMPMVGISIGAATWVSSRFQQR